MSIWRKLFLHYLSLLQEGQLTVSENGRQYQFGRADPAASEPAVEITIHQPSVYRDTILRGDKGAALSFIQGHWSASDLAGVMTIYLRNLAAFKYLNYRWRRVGSFLKKINWRSQKKSKQQILYHYDLSNEFFELLLDPSMMYSCAIFPSADSSLEEASYYKLQRISEALSLCANDHLLEIGSGWGGMAIYAAQHYGCQVTTTTISDRQYDYVSRKVAELGLTDKITVLNQDYRLLTGRFDKLVSIEMIEAIGYQYFDTFMRQCDHLLKPDGLALIQTITIADQVFDFYKHGNDFIRQFIFPGGCLPSVHALCDSAARVSKLQLIHLEDIGKHYVRTLQHWLANLRQYAPQIQALGFDEHFLRMWEYYFSYCIAGFQERYISDVHLLWRKQSFETIV
jgi:cyclopropane-fatty-acyl-phospholipid synthase